MRHKESYIFNCHILLAAHMHMWGSCILVSVLFLFQAVFEENMAACAPLLHKHLAPVLKKDTMYLIFQVEEQQKRGNAKASEEALMPLLCAYFKENERQLFQVFEEGTSITEKLEELPLTPTVIALGSIFSKQCFVTCDHEVLFSQALSFTEATCLMFLCYYVFNITYAEEGSTTLEFLQRLLFHIQPSTGTKAQGKKSRTSVHNKIMSLARKLQVKC
ncbi:uncharacterized protein LOC119459130 isoform X5 [Dermacentor silvarum]|uniref:uncharacterized protein LOC125942031 n=2 Tax=Dermacentor silvarum TaxID=543639 RepID=UPI002100AFE6|nr:uncharacterized protein LOC119459130 isoform X1 [Dermacentor silvarum]XP_049515904.1 uncharacterized protein LOC125942031 [Dermacentor silvarum]XP_049527119.1 uncharacterized protein LOC119459130 isoform X5 [Dermacentor silvarum]